MDGTKNWDVCSMHIFNGILFLGRIISNKTLLTSPLLPVNTHPFIISIGEEIFVIMSKKSKYYLIFRLL